MRNRRKAAALILAALLTGLISDAGEGERFPGALVVSATSGTQQKIDEAEKKKQELENDRKENEGELSGLKAEQSGLKKDLKSLNEQLTQIVANLEDLERQIHEKEQEISDTQDALAEARATEEWQYLSMVERARAMYEMKDESYVNALLKEKSLSDVLNAADYMERVAAYERKMMDQYIANREFIESEEARLQTEKENLDSLKAQAQSEEARVSELIAQTSDSIAKYGDQIADAEARAREYEEQIKKEEENLEYLRKKLAEEIALSQAAANAAWRDISEVTFAEGDRYLLANLIYCEAGGEPYAGKLAVASVVINRVLSSKYPDTVVGVIYQSGQFSPVRSGRLDLALASGKATDACYRAADEAMAGTTNVGNCVYFRTPVEGLTGINIGGHVFY